jgi:nucleotide-binding universal stress UspA family protein
MKILVPIDGSESAFGALRYALGLAKSTRASLHLVHAGEELPDYGEIAAYLPRGRFEALQREHAEAILREATDVLRDKGVSYTGDIVSGQIAKAIAAQADRLGCDLIVMGTRGMSAIGNLLMGSVAAKVVHLSHVPVTLVKPTHEPLTEGSP